MYTAAQKCNQSACFSTNKKETQELKLGSQLGSAKKVILVLHSAQVQEKSAKGHIKTDFFFFLVGGNSYFKLLMWHIQHLYMLQRHNLLPPLLCH